MFFFLEIKISGKSGLLGSSYPERSEVMLLTRSWPLTPDSLWLYPGQMHHSHQPKPCMITLVSRFHLLTELFCVCVFVCVCVGNSTFSPVLSARLSCCHYTVQMTASLCMHALAKWIFTFGQIQGRRGRGGYLTVTDSIAFRMARRAQTRWSIATS